ncbi:MAG: replicative DNA helicase [Calditerrivibrio sp.]|nr:replicative DNA helicase [Calditerrivibrio sp.]MCA1932929.1 replicative DNA helicase [Calditerrivibrio sp.]MCA1980193.1 replicative DNA helicase [Calditerrivibrio sp.]
MANSNYKTLPYSVEAEQAVLASIILDNRALDRVIHLISSEDFHVPYNRLIMNNILSLHEDGRVIDIVTLIDRLTNENLIDKAGGVEYITGLVSILPNSANVVHYANIVREKSLQRKLIEKTTEISESAYNYTGDIHELLDEAERKIFAVAESRIKGDIKPIGSIINSTFEMIEALYNRQDQITGTPTGFTDLDRLTNGLQKSDLIVVAGRPAMGKTAFALNIGLNSCIKYSKTIAMFSLEMSSGQLVQRLLSAEANIDAQKLRNGKLTIDEWQKLAAVASELHDINFFIDDTPAISVTEVRAKSRRIKRDKGLDLVIVDYLQLMSSNKGDSREQQISEISRSLKALAKELDVPVIALSQLNRSVESRQDKRPIPSDLRESGAIEQDADLVIFLYRDEVYNKDTKEPNVAEIIIAKHRNGPTGTVKLTFLKQFTKFANLEQHYS